MKIIISLIVITVIMYFFIPVNLPSNDGGFNIQVSKEVQQKTKPVTTLKPINNVTPDVINQSNRVEIKAKPEVKRERRSIAEIKKEILEKHGDRSAEKAEMKKRLIPVRLAQRANTKKILAIAKELNIGTGDFDEHPATKGLIKKAYELAEEERSIEREYGYSHPKSMPEPEVLSH